MGAKLLGKAIERLDTAGAAMRCADVVRLLENLGFTVRDGRLGGHKVVVHPISRTSRPPVSTVIMAATPKSNGLTSGIC
ncbi:MAG: type II toxin-antitoxin system HicA family toxin [Xanthomonadales bacterium]|nr:type II toxin-antitoxin system HicA family toxin [Xanthomonadales bacterium]